MEGYLLGIDNGLSVEKAVVFDTQGNEIGSYSLSSQYDKNDGTMVEADLTKIWERTAYVVKKAIEVSGVNSKEILAVANSASGNGLYFLDKDGQPFHHAVLPMDLRAMDIVKDWNESAVCDELFEYTTQNLWPGQPAPILRWLKLNQPEVYHRIAMILFRKDWIKYKLTGTYTTDYSDISSAGLFDNVNKKYNRKIYELYRITEVSDFLPNVLKSHEVCGYITKPASEQTGLVEGTPVAGGMFDVDACCLGSGVIAQGLYEIIAGTWSINAAVSESVVKSRNIVQSTIFADGEQYLNIDSGATSTINLEWFLNTLAKKYQKEGYEACEKAVERFNADDVSIIFLPYLHSPIKFPDLNASFIGLQAHHKLEDILRAVYEGIAFGHRQNIESLQSCGFEIQKARFTGGACNSKAWCTIFSDVLGMEIETVATNQSGALGAAMAAGIAAGVYKDYEDAVCKVVRVKDVYRPDIHNTKRYTQKYEKFKKAMKALSNL